MSDTEFSPPKTRIPFHIDCSDLCFKEREPKCVNSLCNLINTRLKLLENEIVAQHKVWEYIQREVDEVKSLIEDCTSTCDSSSLSGHENESEIVDSALESHKTCNSVLWDKIKQAEENLEEKKSLMQLLSSDVSRLKNSKKSCKRKSEKANSNIDLILDVTNGLHVLKCDECKFCSEHLDFREGLLSSVIELIHFSEKNYNSCLEENKVLKSCLQKIFIKIKRCFLHSQIYVRNTRFQQQSFEIENSVFSADNIYSSFEEFCHHFQTLQEELMQLKHILLAAEESHLDDIFQSSHSSDCRCFNNAKKNDSCLEGDYCVNEAKFSKSNEKGSCSYEKKIKTLSCCDEIENADSDTMFEANQMFGASSNHTDKQLEMLRSRIFNAVRIIRDVEVEESDDENLINMVTSLSEECSALRQEVSYLRNVRQEKKRTWNKLQCFIMDAERKLKGSRRNITGLREVISDLGQVIATTESSSLDETVLYMYSNQLEWLEKVSMGCESPSDLPTSSEGNAIESLQPELQNETVACATVSTQTAVDSDGRVKAEFDSLKSTCDIAIQTESLSCISSVIPSHMFESSFQEINREIYVVPEVLEESDSSLNSFNEGNSVKDVDAQNILDNPVQGSEFEMNCSSECQNLVLDSDSYTTSEADSSTSILPLSGRFPVNMNFSSKDNFRQLIMPLQDSTRSSPSFNMPDIPLIFGNEDFSNVLSEETFNVFNYLNYSDLFFSLFLNSNTNIEHIYNSVLHNLLKDDVKSIEICDEENNMSYFLFKSNTSPSSLNFSGESIRCLPYAYCTNIEQNEYSFIVDQIKSNENQDIHPHNTLDDITLNVRTDFPIFSSMPKETELLPNDDVVDCGTTIGDDDSANFSATALDSSSIDHLKKENSAEDTSLCSSNEGNFTLERSGTFVCEKPTSACREGTFIIDSGDKLLLNKSKICDESLYFTAVLTALASNEPHRSEKNYILYEVCDSLKNSMVVLESINPYLVSNFENKPSSEQHFILCETTADEENINSQAFSSKVFCHIVFFKSSLVEENSVVEKPLDTISGFYPLLPQYLPPENCSYGSFEHVSHTQNCEIYMCNRDTCKLEKESENAAFIPKNYFKFKETFAFKNSSDNFLQDNTLCQTAFNQNLNSFSTSFDGNGVSESDFIEVKHITDLNNEPKINSKETLVESYDKEVQVDEFFYFASEEMNNRLKNFSQEVHESELKTSDDVIAKRDDVEDSDSSPNIIHYENEAVASYNQRFQDQVVRETSLLDEIDALKDNLNQQNAVLLRLKEDLEESNYRLAEKEQLLVFLQLEHSRLNTLLTENGVREIDEKECQTDSNDINYETLEKEVCALRQKNLQHYEKIVHQNNTIQSVKSQLSATISHLKHLKDAATKQLKKQKHHVMKSVKLKQQLHDTKTELEKKCKEIEKKNEILSDQEFHLHEIQARLDTTEKELNGKAKLSITQSPDLEKVDFGCQADVGRDQSCDKHKENCPQKTEHDMTLKKHSEELLKLKAKFQHLESVLSSKKDYKTLNDDVLNKPVSEQKYPAGLKEGNIWKLLTVSEQSYLSLLNKLSEALQISDLKGASVLMHSSWLNCDDLADARRQDHKKILQCLEKMKRNIRYLQETINLEPKRQNVENILTDERKSSFVCHSEEMHYQYLCEVLQRAQENLVKEYSQKRTSHRAIVTAGSGRTSRHAGSRERRIPLELKNGKILAMLDDKLNHKELLPSKFDYDKMECKSGHSSSKSKTPT